MYLLMYHNIIVFIMIDKNHGYWIHVYNILYHNLTARGVPGRVMPRSIILYRHRNSHRECIDILHVYIVFKV